MKYVAVSLIFTVLSKFSLANHFFQDTIAVTDSNIVESQVFINADSGSIYGTLAIPKKFDKKTAVLIIAGSGPTDRDGNSPMIKGKNDGLKQLAHALAKAGYASVRYDKRGIGKSFKAGRQEKDLRFDQYVQDAAQLINWMRLELGFRKVVVVGHSEGSLIGMLAAERTGAEGFVSLCGPGRAASEILKEQLDKQLTNDSLRLEVHRDLDSLRDGHSVRSFPLPLLSIFRPSVQPYLISWMQHEPAVVIARLEIPVLVVQGKRDVQVTERDARLLYKAALNSKLLLVKNMNHVLKEVGADDVKHPLKSYQDPSYPLAEKMVEAVVKYLNELR